MKGREAKQRCVRKGITQTAFAKVFTFKRKDETNIVRKRSIPLSCVEANRNSVLIVPSVQRLTASSPPLALLDSIHGTMYSSSLAPPGVRTNNCFFKKMKKAQKRNNLPDTLMYGNDKLDRKHSFSAWERHKPSSCNSSGISSSPSPSRATEKSQTMGIEITPSSNSEFLPPDISPANKFVPIGHEEDDDATWSTPDDNDFSTRSDGENSHQKPAFTTIEYSDDIMQDKYSVPLDDEAILHRKHPPSPLSTDGTSSMSRESYVPAVRMKGRQTPFRYGHAENDWFPSVKIEIMKLASCFTQCGAGSKSTI